GGNMKADVWTVIQARLAVLKGQLLITTTWYNLGWLYNQIYKPWQQGDPHYLVVQWSSEHNPFFPKEEYERVKATMDPYLFDMRYRAVPRKRMGLVYPSFNDELILDETDPRWPQVMNRVIAGIDWGFTNPAAVAVIGQNYDNNYFLLDE